jgi:hypothetical protein
MNFAEKAEKSTACKINKERGFYRSLMKFASNIALLIRLRL